MADVRLTATNPVDSSVVPVAANSKGELLVAEPTVSEINNDLTINGDLTVTGTINGSSGGGGEPGGEYLPEPFGEDGTVLTIVNGAPAWAAPQEGGGGGGPTGPTARYVDNSIVGGPGSGTYDCAGQGVTVDSDQDAWARALSCWDNPADPQLYKVISSGAAWASSITLECENVLGRVLTLSFNGRFNYTPSNSQVLTHWASTVTHDAQNIQTIKDYESFSRATSGWFHWDTEMSFLFNRDSYGEITFTNTVTADQVPSGNSSYINWLAWKLEDAGDFALRQQMKVQKRMQELEKALQALKA